MSLATSLWVDAYRRRIEQEGAFAHVVRRGDAENGAVLVTVATMDGRATLYQRSFDLMTGDRRWVVLAEGTEAEAADAVRRQAGFDPDLWVVEVEDPKGRHLLDDESLA
ncbi:DUF1491 family protein [Jannaschia sp. Os4]|uniref:DUF1491 family protein n=1 Tax=Jannaschia sp. Os4 TaxID=2807617 RepID=UPI00193A1B83|nr:DUF1491 family protein [Jannaschia sp. Os4]MBM2577194.1 DUF1491 family protein [Jannaschia sp. Os4]